MRESIGTTTTLKMALAFTILFSGFLAVAISYNKVFKMKNEVMSILQKYEGASDDGLAIVNNYLKNNGYNIKNKCDDNEYGMLDLNDVNSYVKNSEKKYYCISCEDTQNGSYYTVKLFFRFNLPFLGDLTTYKITGETKGIYNGKRCYR